MDSEQMLRAAYLMRDAAESIKHSADTIAEAVRRFEVQVDPSFGGAIPRLLEKLESHDGK